jgi:hypothetical protein
MSKEQVDISTKKYPDKFVIVDSKDALLLKSQNWKMSKRGYARLAFWEDKKTKHILLHRYLLGVTDSKVLVDHINGDRLDNRRINLRTCNRKQNNQNRRADLKNVCGFKGVCFISRIKKWRAEIKNGPNKETLGYFNDPVSAALAYNDAANRLFGDFAYFNKVDLA